MCYIWRLNLYVCTDLIHTCCLVCLKWTRTWRRLLNVLLKPPFHHPIRCLTRQAEQHDNPVTAAHHPAPPLWNRNHHRICWSTGTWCCTVVLQFSSILDQWSCPEWVYLGSGLSALKMCSCTSGSGGSSSARPGVLQLGFFSLPQRFLPRRWMWLHPPPPSCLCSSSSSSSACSSSASHESYFSPSSSYSSHFSLLSFVLCLLLFLFFPLPHHPLLPVSVGIEGIMTDWQLAQPIGFTYSCRAEHSLAGLWGTGMYQYVY